MSPARRASSWGSIPYLTKPPSVPMIHQRGRSIRQIRLDSIVKEHVVEFEHHPAVTAAIDAFPGGGGDPGRDATAGAKSELKSLIDQVRAPVVQDRTRRVGAARASRAAARTGRPSSQRGWAGRSRPSSSNFLHRQVVPIPAPVVKDREHAAGAVAGGDHPVGVGGGEGHHLVDHAVFARIQRPDSQIGVAVVGGRDHDELDGGVGQGVVQIGIAAHVVAPECQGLRANARRRAPRFRVSSDRAGA